MPDRCRSFGRSCCDSRPNPIVLQSNRVRVSNLCDSSRRDFFVRGRVCGASGCAVRHVTTGFGPRLLRSPRRPANAKVSGNECSREYISRGQCAWNDSRRFAGVGGEGWKGERVTRRRIVCKNLVKSLTKRQSDWVGVKRNAALTSEHFVIKLGVE